MTLVDHRPPSSHHAAVAGIDGCRAGWVVARLGATDERPSVTMVADLGPVAHDVATGALTHVAIDMPIGLPDRGSRQCDIAARRLLGPRRSSVFPAPVRATVGAASYPEALVRSRASAGVGLSKQAYNLLASIAEVEAVVRRLGQRQVTETHPELAFAALNGGPLAEPKRHPRGAATRARLLAGAFPGITAVLECRLRGARHDDVADACALAWSARRLLAGTATILGGDTDATGLRMEIAW